MMRFFSRLDGSFELRVKQEEISVTAKRPGYNKLFIYKTMVFYSSENNYLTIIPRAQMGYESIAHEAEGRMGS